MNKKSETNISYALLAIQNALLGVIIPELRAVCINLDEKENIFYINFYYHGKVSEEIIDLWECATTEASASLGPDFFTDYKIERIDYPNKIPFDGRLVFLRKE
jgi:hypothetical protein